MRSLLAGPSPHPLFVTALRTVGVLMLTPLILVAGLVAVVALTSWTLSRRLVPQKSAPQPASAAPAADVLRLEHSATEPVLQAIGSRAA